MARRRKPYRIRRHRHKDKKTGQIREASRHSIYFDDPLGMERRLTGTRDKTSSEYIARNVVAIVNLRSSNQPLTPEARSFIESQPKKLREKLLLWGILDTDTNASFEPLMEYSKVKARHSKRLRPEVTGGHVLHWRKSMEANERSSQHISESVARVARVIEGCRFTTPSDINGEKLKNWMSDWRDKGKSAGSANAHLASFKSFVRWMLSTTRISQNPVQYVQPLKKLDREHPRRALTFDEVSRLLTVAVDADKHHGLTGYERSLVYRLALRTGLRYNEIRTLRRADITFGANLQITVKARNAKNKKAQSVPLFPELAKELERYFSENLAMPHAKVFSGMWKNAGAETLRPDLELAGIEYETEEGFADFHSLRHACSTMLDEAGVRSKMVQEIMRHSNINLTMGTYTHLQDSDKADAVSKVPPFKILKPKRAKTGTADVPENLTANLTEDRVKIRKDPVKSVKGEVVERTAVEDVRTCKRSNLEHLTTTRPAGREPATDGLPVRCSLLHRIGREILGIVVS
ncbi:MAG: tyrosine-type recombinase/integrase [Planctomycetota bacterium]|jgi:integrase